MYRELVARIALTIAVSCPVMAVPPIQVTGVDIDGSGVVKIQDGKMQAPSSTTDLPEGSNLYWTPVRAAAYPGPAGPKGDKGDKGDTGNTGASGADGAAGVPHPRGPQRPSGFVGHLHLDPGFLLGDRALDLIFFS